MIDDKKLNIFKINSINSKIYKNKINNIWSRLRKKTPTEMKSLLKKKGRKGQHHLLLHFHSSLHSLLHLKVQKRPQWQWLSMGRMHCHHWQMLTQISQIVADREVHLRLNEINDENILDVFDYQEQGEDHQWHRNLMPKNIKKLKLYIK